MDHEVVVAPFFIGPLLQQISQHVDHAVYRLGISTGVLEDSHEVVSAPNQAAMQPGHMLKEAERPLQLLRLHQLAAGFGDGDICRGRAAPEGASYVNGEAEHFRGWPAGSRHVL
ncbi:MAG: hypothetical protein AUH78_20345 [Gemmatimonadetes bacterium 13_1_40CM_4_69_8]|nr:MAG: hypothetical protein AUH78_20345 [Gemmatimonadetes bacterium 13_1_40CM_4_69_8]